MLCKKKYGLITAAALILTALAACSQAVPPVQLAPKPAAPIVADNQSLSPVSETPAVQTEQADVPASSVRILLIHYRGSLQPLGCCNQGLYERDEFVAIQNTDNVTQNIAGWKLENITRGYPSFIFPAYFPCLPLSPSTDDKYVVNSKSYVSNAPQTVEQVFATRQSTQQQATSPAIDWSACSPIAPLDETPLKLIGDQKPGQQVPCMLYPGQILLVFTDEIHCQYGGLSFKYGHGNIWNNEKPDTAVLYNSRGEEVSRKSYTTIR